MITIRHLTKSYGRRSVLTDINAALAPGRVYGVVGENGAGKTTLFSCLGGQSPYKGDIEHPFPGPLRNSLGFLPTTPVFISRITGWEYLKFVCAARGVDTENFSEQNIFDLPLDEYAENYSTGMSKKLALYGLLLQQNEVYLLDEPFSGVDIQSNILILDVIAQLKRLGKIVVLSSHVFATLRECCDELYWLKEGRLIGPIAPPDFKELESGLREGFQRRGLDWLR